MIFDHGIVSLIVGRRKQLHVIHSKVEFVLIVLGATETVSQTCRGGILSNSDGQR